MMFEEFTSEPVFEVHSDNFFEFFLNLMHLATREFRSYPIPNLLEQCWMCEPARDRYDPVSIRPFWYGFAGLNLLGPTVTE